jgi:pyruvate formate lyase activating enzyme
MSAISVDPIEKKPIFHFLPGTTTFSIGAPGCNFTCLGCQNHTLSRVPLEWRGFPGDKAQPEALVEEAIVSGASSIAFTYSEPTVFFEYAQEVALAAAEKGLPSVWVTNGYMSSTVLEQLENVVAINIDLKGFSDSFYREVTGASLAPILGNISLALDLGIWVEVTTLLIPGLNDSEEQLRALTNWLASRNPDLPWHVSRFVPCFKQNHLPATPIESLEKAVKIGQESGLNHIYVGNVLGKGYADTICPQCGTALIVRKGFMIEKCLIDKNGICPNCNNRISGCWI